MVLALLAEASGAAAEFGPELIGFIAGSGGTIFGAGMVFATAKKRLEDAEKKIAAAAEACASAMSHEPKIVDLEKRQVKLVKRVEDLEADKLEVAKAVMRLVDFMRHTPGQAVPHEVLDDISDVLGTPTRRAHQDSI